MADSTKAMPRTRIIPNTILPFAKLDHINGDAIDLEDCEQVYGDDEFACLDDNNCTHDLGHEYLNGRCVHCGVEG